MTKNQYQLEVTLNAGNTARLGFDSLTRETAWKYAFHLTDQFFKLSEVQKIELRQIVLKHTKN